MEYGAWVGLLTFISMFVFLMLGVPIFICLFAAAFVGSDWRTHLHVAAICQRSLSHHLFVHLCRCPSVRIDVHIGCKLRDSTKRL